MPAPEPRFARIAAMIGDPTRARMLSLLMDGSWRAAGELARAAGVTAPTASRHVAQLVEAGLLEARAQGRHRYFRLADADIAHALEALSLVAERDAAATNRWDRGPYKPLKAARTCYGHLAGELGVRLFEGMLARGTLVPEGANLVPSEAGRDELASLGVAVPPAGTKRMAYPCVDWSERRDHLAGPLAVAWLAKALEAGHVRRAKDSRAITLTPEGALAWARWLG